MYIRFLVPMVPFACIPMGLDARKPDFVKLTLSHWYPGSGVVLDCIDA